MDFSMDGKTALVTGSNRGTGLIIAQQPQHEGARVIYHAPDQQLAQNLAELLSADSSDTRPENTAFDIVHGDLTCAAGAAQVAEQVNSISREINILVNNFGAAGAARWHDDGVDDWLAAYQTNTLSAVRMVKLFRDSLAAGDWGRIVNLGTVGSTRPNRRSPGYYAAKGALANLTVSLMQELSGTGITVNLVSPGLIRTPEVEQAYLERARARGWGNTFEEAEAAIVGEYAPNPTGRMATRADVASVVVFLCSRQAGFINGQNVRVDGGALAIV